MMIDLAKAPFIHATWQGSRSVFAAHVGFNERKETVPSRGNRENDLVDNAC